MMVGIVIIAYNSEPYVEDAIRSVFQKTHTDWRLVIVDDGSRDKTPEIAGKFAEKDRRVSVIVQANGGPGAARDTGFSALESHCEAIMFLDGDDALEPSALEHMCRTLDGASDDVVDNFSRPPPQ